MKFYSSPRWPKTCALLGMLLTGMLSVVGFQREGGAQPPFAFTRPPLEALFYTRELDFGLVDIGSLNEDSLYHLQNTSLEVVVISIATNAPGVTVTPTQVSLDPKSGATVPITVRWQPTTAMALDHTLVFSSYVNETWTGDLTWDLKGRAGAFRLEIDGQPATALDFGPVPLGQVASRTLDFINHSASPLDVTTLGQTSELQVDQTNFVLPASGTFAMNLNYQPAQAQLMETLSFRSNTTKLDLAVSGQGLAEPELALFDALGNPVSAYDFGEFTVDVDDPLVEIEVRNVGNAATSQNAMVTGFEVPTALVFCTSGAFNICAQDTASGQKPDIRNMQPGEARTIRFFVHGEVAGTFEKTFGFVDGQIETELTLSGDVVPFLLPRWNAAGTEGGNAPSNGDYLTSPIGPKLAPGLGMGKAFTVDDIDNINLFNGNLVLQIPLGQAYPAGGSLSYGFKLTYNANAWDVRFKEERQPPGVSVTASVVSPDPKANAGHGFSLHLGRLFEPVDLSYYNQLSQTEQEKLPHIGSDWVYNGPDNATHAFYSALHRPMGYDPSPGVAYTRDGSYLRLVDKGFVNGFQTKELQFPDGVVHTFVRKNQWNDPWPDAWRITKISDPNGNTVTVTYQNMTWKISDQYGRQQFLHFEAGVYWPMRVRELVLTAFGGNTASYQFEYSVVPSARPGDNFLGHSSGVTMSVLDRVRLPDGTTYEFDIAAHPEAGVRKVVLPTDASLEFEFEQFTFPYALLCNSEANPPHPSQPGVSKRIVRDANGTILQTRHFLRGFYQGDAIEDLFCSNVYHTFTLVNPDAEMVVGVFSPTAGDKGRLDLHYFSVWPFGVAPDNPDAGGGWTNHDFGRPFTRNDPDPEDPQRLLSTRTYALFTGTINGSEDPKQLAQTGQLLQTNYVAYEQEETYCSNLDPGFGCADVNARVFKTSTVYHNDGNRRAHTTLSNYDGLGHYRRKTTSGNIGDDNYTYVTDYHPWRGELILEPGGGIDPNSTFLAPGVNEPWQLNTFTKKTVKNNTTQQIRGTAYTFQWNKGLLTKERVWATGTSDRSYDLARVHEYNSAGERTATGFYGGDIQALPVGNGSDHNFAGESIPQGPQYKILNTYQFGVLKKSQYDGVSHYLTNNTEIDANTGMVKTSTDPSGTRTKTHLYSTMGRLVRVTSSQDANLVFEYKIPGVSNWNDPPRLRAYQYRNGTFSGAANRLTEQEIYFDALGRITREDAKHPDGYSMRSDFTYNQQGWITKESTTQRHDQFDPAKATRYEYDVLGNVTKATKPDNSAVTQLHRGVREVEIRANVGTGLGAGGQILQTQAVTTIQRDRQGRIAQVITPHHTTAYQYDPNGLLTQATRGGQSRVFDVDGRGFTLSERLPEKGANGNGYVSYFDHDALGNVGRKVDGPFDTAYEYDEAGREVLVSDAASGDPILERYYDTTPGPNNGLLQTATRYNRVTPENTGGAIPTADTRVVTEDYFYGTDGRMRQRDTLVTTGSGLEVVAFTQSWQYNDLGQVESQTYPECTTPGCWDTPRNLAYTYRQGLLESVAQGLPEGASWQYHDNGMPSQILHANGLTDTYNKPSSNLVRPQSIQLASGQLDLGTYQYDGTNNIVKIGSDVFLYDLNRRLVRGDIPGGAAGDYRLYSYDNYDNLAQKGPDMLNPSPTSNRLTDYTYDAAGNTTVVTPYNMYYDSFGLQEAMIYNPNQSPSPCALGNASGDCWVYWYGPSNLRIGGIALLEDGSGDYFWTVRDLDGKVLRTYTSLTGTLTFSKDYIYGGKLLVATKASGANSQQHYHNDHLGTPRVKSDRWGNFVGTQHLMAFGTPSGQNGVDEPIVEWTGHEKDPNELTHYMKARSYFNGWGRFLSPDPARSGWNLYTYGDNNPINRVDPSGLDPRDPGLDHSLNECVPGEPGCDHTYMPAMPTPEEATTYTGVIGDSRGGLKGGEGAFLEISDGTITDFGYYFFTQYEIGYDVTKDAMKSSGLKSPAVSATIKPNGDFTVSGWKEPYLRFSKEDGVLPLVDVDMIAFADTPTHRYQLDENGFQKKELYKTNAPFKVAGRITSKGKISARATYNYLARAVNAVGNWARTCGGFCDF